MEEEDVKIKMIELYDSLSSHKYTSVFHEEKYGTIVPHKFIIVDKSTIGNRENMVPTILGSVDFQSGEILKEGINGVMDENLVAILIRRLEGFQSSPYSCKENAMALTKLQEALLWMKKRTSDREIRGVEGTHTV